MDLSVDDHHRLSPWFPPVGLKQIGDRVPVALDCSEVVAERGLRCGEGAPVHGGAAISPRCRPVKISGVADDDLSEMGPAFEVSVGGRRFLERKYPVNDRPQL